MISPQAVVSNALRDGHLLFDEVADPLFSVEVRVHRNMLQLVRTRRQTLVHKQFETSEDCQRESSALRAADQADRRYELPRVLAHQHRSLLTRTSPSLEPLGCSRATAPTVTRVARCAEAIASVHGVPLNAGIEPAAQPIRLDGIGPWILDAPPAVSILLDELRQPDVRDAVNAVLETLSTGPTVWSHGDIRPANLLLGPSGTVCLVDWETAGRASRWQDLGALLATVVELALQVGQGPPSGALTQTIVRTYASAARVKVNLPVVVRAAGLKLLQTAVEQAFQEWEPSRRTQATLTAGKLLLLQPTRAAIHLRIHHG